MICAHISVVLRSKYVSNYPTLYVLACIPIPGSSMVHAAVRPLPASASGPKLLQGRGAEEFSRKEKGDFVGGFEGFLRWKFRVWGSWGLEVETRRVWGARFRIWGLRSRVYVCGFMLGRAGRLSTPRGQPWSCRFLTQPPSTVKQLRVHEDGRAM